MTGVQFGKDGMAGVRKGDKGGIKRSFVLCVTRPSDFAVIMYLIPVFYSGI